MPPERGLVQRVPPRGRLDFVDVAIGRELLHPLHRSVHAPVAELGPDFLPLGRLGLPLKVRLAGGGAAQREQLRVHLGEIVEEKLLVGGVGLRVMM